MARHAWLGHADANDQRMALLQSANDSLRAKLGEALDAVTHFRERAVAAEAALDVMVKLPGPDLEAMHKRLEDARDHGGLLQRRWAKQMLGED